MQVNARRMNSNNGAASFQSRFTSVTTLAYNDACYWNNSRKLRYFRQMGNIVTVDNSTHLTSHIWGTTTQT